jgi:hypothetical protein
VLIKSAHKCEDDVMIASRWLGKSLQSSMLGKVQCSEPSFVLSLFPVKRLCKLHLGKSFHIAVEREVVVRHCHVRVVSPGCERLEISR